jgi:hypothetical protein
MRQTHPICHTAQSKAIIHAVSQGAGMLKYVKVCVTRQHRMAHFVVCLVLHGLTRRLPLEVFNVFVYKYIGPQTYLLRSMSNQARCRVDTALLLSRKQLCVLCSTSSSRPLWRRIAY